MGSIWNKKSWSVSWLVCSVWYIIACRLFENFRDQFIEIYELDPAHFVSAPGLAWQACLKKTGVKLELLTGLDMLLIVEKGIRGGMCQSTLRYAKANNKYMKNYYENIVSSFLMYLDAYKFYGWALPQKRPVGGFKCVKKLSKFNERFIKGYNENSNIGYFLEVYVEYPKKVSSLHKDFPFLPEWEKINKCEKFICNIKDKESYVDHIRALKQALNHGLKLKRVGTQGNSI